MCVFNSYDCNFLEFVTVALRIRLYLMHTISFSLNSSVAAARIRPYLIFGCWSFENVAMFEYLRMTVTTQNLIREEIKSRLNSGNSCYRSVQNLLLSRLLSKNVKIKIYKTINLPVILYGCETCSLTLKEECELRSGCWGEYLDWRRMK
jgi:hypothetical protein